MAIFSQANFNLVGVACSLGATLFRAAKTIIQKKLLSGSKVDPATLLYLMSPQGQIF
jgi:hypothetical protein